MLYALLMDEHIGVLTVHYHDVIMVCHDVELSLQKRDGKIIINNRIPYQHGVVYGHGFNYILVYPEFLCTVNRKIVKAITDGIKHGHRLSHHP